MLEVQDDRQSPFLSEIMTNSDIEYVNKYHNAAKTNINNDSEAEESNENIANAIESVNDNEIQIKKRTWWGKTKKKIKTLAPVFEPADKQILALPDDAQILKSIEESGNPIINVYHLKLLAKKYEKKYDDAIKEITHLRESKTNLQIENELLKHNLEEIKAENVRLVNDQKNINQFISSKIDSIFYKHFLNLANTDDSVTIINTFKSLLEKEIATNLILQGKLKQYEKRTNIDTTHGASNIEHKVITELTSPIPNSDKANEHEVLLENYSKLINKHNQLKVEYDGVEKKLQHRCKQLSELRELLEQLEKYYQQRKNLSDETQYFIKLTNRLFQLNNELKYKLEIKNNFEKEVYNPTHSLKVTKLLLNNDINSYSSNENNINKSIIKLNKGTNVNPIFRIRKHSSKLQPGQKPQKNYIQKDYINKKDICNHPTNMLCGMCPNNQLKNLPFGLTKNTELIDLQKIAKVELEKWNTNNLVENDKIRNNRQKIGDQYDSAQKINSNPTKYNNKVKNPINNYINSNDSVGSSIKEEYSFEYSQSNLTYEDIIHNIKNNDYVKDHEYHKLEHNYDKICQSVANKQFKYNKETKSPISKTTDTNGHHTKDDTIFNTSNGERILKYDETKKGYKVDHNSISSIESKVSNEVHKQQTIEHNGTIKNKHSNTLQTNDTYNNERTIDYKVKQKQIDEDAHMIESSCKTLQPASVVSNSTIGRLKSKFENNTTITNVKQKNSQLSPNLFKNKASENNLQVKNNDQQTIKPNLIGNKKDNFNKLNYSHISDNNNDVSNSIMHSDVQNFTASVNGSIDAFSFEEAVRKDLEASYINNKLNMFMDRGNMQPKLSLDEIKLKLDLN